MKQNLFIYAVLAIMVLASLIQIAYVVDSEVRQAETRQEIHKLEQQIKRFKGGGNSSWDSIPIR